MSEVISFRLDKSNPREAQALEKLNHWISRGYSIRFILTQALLGIDDVDADTVNHPTHEFDMVVNQLNRLFELLTNPITIEAPILETNTNQSKLRESFLTAVKQGIKPGVKIEDG